MRSALSQGLDTNGVFDKNGGTNDKESLAAARRARFCGRLRDRGSGETRTGTRTEACPGACAGTRAKASARDQTGGAQAEAG